MEEIAMQLPLVGSPADLSELEAVVALNKVVQNMPQSREDEFDSRYRSDANLVEIVSWATGGGGALAVLAALKLVLMKYLSTRNKEIVIKSGKNELKMKGPISKKQIDETIDKFFENQ